VPIFRSGLFIQFEMNNLI